MVGPFHLGLLILLLVILIFFPTYNVACLAEPCGTASCAYPFALTCYCGLPFAFVAVSLVLCGELKERQLWTMQQEKVEMTPNGIGKLS